MFFQLPWLPEAALSAFDFAGLRRMMTGTARPGVFSRADMANAIRAAFGADADHMAVAATKSMTGHLLGAAGALEAVITVLSVHHRLVPAAINIDDLDPAIDLDVVRSEARTLPEGDIAALNNSFGFGGHNVALTIRSAS